MSNPTQIERYKKLLSFIDENFKEPINIEKIEEDGIIKYGALFSLIMYVFQYMENVINLPLFYQNWLRLQEIQARMEQV
ncbi:MAG: hypothetical protein AAF573_21925 [Bacteroidota bacterium]